MTGIIIKYLGYSFLLHIIALIEADNIPISIQGNWFSQEYKFYLLYVWTGSTHEIDGRKFPLQVGITKQYNYVNISYKLLFRRRKVWHKAIWEVEGSWFDPSIGRSHIYVLDSWLPYLSLFKNEIPRPIECMSSINVLLNMCLLQHCNLTHPLVAIHNFWSYDLYC